MSAKDLLSSEAVSCPLGLLRKAQQVDPVETVIVNAGSKIAMESAKLATEHGLIAPTFVGSQQVIQLIAKDFEWDISKFRIVDCKDEEGAAKRSVSLVANREVASLMKGDIHTDVLLRAILRSEQNLLEEETLSHVFHMTIPGSDASLCITDAVINIAPDVDTKINIIRNAVALSHSLGNNNPHVAVLSATEVASKVMPSSIEAEQVSKLAVDGAVKGATVYGPLAFDNAVSPEAAEIKGINSPVAGNADILLVPNIETGNALFKQMVYFMSAAAAGLVLGAKVPIILTSRADPPAARLAGAALASIYAGYRST